MLTYHFFTMASLVLSASVVLAGINDCKPHPPPANGAVQLAFTEMDQLLAVFSCDTGYTALGDTIISCDNGQWDKIPPLCASLKECELNNKNSEDIDQSLINLCPKLKSPRNGRMDSDLHRGRLDATFNCNHGYILNGPNDIHCKNGVWDNIIQPDCIPVDCGVPDAPINGTVEYKDTHYTSKAIYSCDECHELRGVRIRSCKPSGLWSKQSPVCVSMSDFPSCDMPELPEGGVILNELEYIIDNMVAVGCGQEVEIGCGLGLELMGATSATCNSDGLYRWNGEEPICVEL